MASGAVGFCSPDLQIIAICEDQHNDAMQDTFLHEVMHALTAAFDLKEKDKEESFVRRLATHLHSVERQPEGVQVVEGVGLVASGFQFSRFNLFLIRNLHAV